LRARRWLVNLARLTPLKRIPIHRGLPSIFEQDFRLKFCSTLLV
jgi:hypothetical protein